MTTPNVKVGDRFVATRVMTLKSGLVEKVVTVCEVTKLNKISCDTKTVEILVCENAVTLPKIGATGGFVYDALPMLIKNGQYTPV